MDIKEIVKKKQVLTESIVALIREFEAETGIEVTNISVGHCDTRKDETEHWQRFPTCRVDVVV